MTHNDTRQHGDQHWIVTDQQLLTTLISVSA